MTIEDIKARWVNRGLQNLIGLLVMLHSDFSRITIIRFNNITKYFKLNQNESGVLKNSTTPVFIPTYVSRWQERGKKMEENCEDCMQWEEELYWTHFQTLRFTQLLLPGFHNRLVCFYHFLLPSSCISSAIWVPPSIFLDVFNFLWFSVGFNLGILHSSDVLRV